MRLSLRLQLLSIIIGFLLIITVSLVFNQLSIQDRSTHAKVLSTAYDLRSDVELIVIGKYLTDAIHPDLSIPINEIHQLIQQLIVFEELQVSTPGDFFVHPAILHDNYRPELAAISASWSEILSYWEQFSKLSPSDADYVVIQRKVTDGESTFLTRVKDFSESLEKLEAEQSQNQSKGQFIYLGLGYLLLAWGSYVILFRVIRPISYLDAAVRLMGHAELTEPVRVVRGDELDRLSRSFDRMRVEITASQKNLETRIVERTNILTEAFEFSQEINSQPNLPNLVDSVTQRARKIMHAKSANVCLLSQDLKRVELQSSHHETYPSVEPNSILQPPLPEDILEGIQNAADEVETICKNHQLQISEEVLSARLYNMGRNIGSIRVSRDKSLPFNEVEKLTFKLLANSTAVAIENLRLTMDARRQAEFNATLNERQRLTSELHDDAAQSLSLLNLKISLLDDLVSAGMKDAASAQIGQSKQLIQRAQVQMRMAFSGIHLPIEQKNNELSKELTDFVEEFCNSSGIPVDLAIGDLSSLTIPALIQKQAMYIYREALTNVRRYADAKNVQVRLEIEGEGLRLVVSDDGRGFNSHHSTSDHHLGLTVMQTRAERVGGALIIETSPGAGTRVTAHIPILAVGQEDADAANST